MKYKKAVESLAYIFSVEENFIEDRIESLVISNWAADAFACGAYSYSTLDTIWARKILSQPVEDTIYFGGEALYKGKEAGTVEGALANGFHVAKKIIIFYILSKTTKGFKKVIIKTFLKPFVKYLHKITLPNKRIPARRYTANFYRHTYC